jgi:RecB family endonuclease NucS
MRLERIDQLQSKPQPNTGVKFLDDLIIEERKQIAKKEEKNKERLKVEIDFDLLDQAYASEKQQKLDIGQEERLKTKITDPKLLKIFGEGINS